MTGARLQDKVGIVTGAAKGMGGTISRVLAQEGADLLLAAREPGPIEELAGDSVGIVISVHELDALHDLNATIHLLHAGTVLATAPTLEGLGAQALSQAYGGAVHFQQRQMPVIRGD